jgi:hypothetical protein
MIQQGLVLAGADAMTGLLPDPLRDWNPDG